MRGNPPLPPTYGRPNLHAMDLFLIGVQVLLLMAALPLLATSLRTSRSHVSRHTGFMVAAMLLVVLALIAALTSLGVASEAYDFDYALAFTPPAFTFVLCLWVIWRAVAATRRRGGMRMS